MPAAVGEKAQKHIQNLAVQDRRKQKNRHKTAGEKRKNQRKKWRQNQSKDQRKSGEFCPKNRRIHRQNPAKRLTIKLNRLELHFQQKPQIKSRKKSFFASFWKQVFYCGGFCIKVQKMNKFHNFENFVSFQLFFWNTRLDARFWNAKKFLINFWGFWGWQLQADFGRIIIQN